MGVSWFNELSSISKLNIFFETRSWELSLQEETPVYVCVWGGEGGEVWTLGKEKI